MLWRGFGGSILILLAGLGISVVPGSSLLMRSSHVAAFRASEVGHTIGVLVLWTGVAIIAWQWIRLVRTVHASDDEPAALRLVRRATVVWSLPLLVAAPLFSRDGWSYAAQGDLLAQGISPYQQGPGVLSGPILEAVDQRWYDTATPYGPLPLWLGSLGARITTDPWVLVIGYRVLALLGLVMLAWAVPRLARWGGASPAWASAVVLASPLAIGTGVGGLHNDVLMAGLMAVALVVGVERGWAYGAVLAGLAAAVKAPGGLVAIGIAVGTLPAAVSLLTRVGRLAAVAVVALGTLFGLGFVTGVGAGWINGLTVPGLVTTPLSATTLIGGLGDLVLRLPFPGLSDHLIRDSVRDAGTFVGLILVLVIALRWRTGDRRAALTATAALTIAVVATSPVVQPWYLFWVVPFLFPIRLDRLWTTASVTALLVLGVNASIDGIVQRFYFSVLVLVLTPLLVLGSQLLTAQGRARLAGWREGWNWLGDDGFPHLEADRIDVVR